MKGLALLSAAASTLALGGCADEFGVGLGSGYGSGYSDYAYSDAISGYGADNGCQRVLKPGESGDRWLNAHIAAPLIVWSIAGTLAVGGDLGGKPLLWALPGAAMALTSFAGMTVGLLVSASALPATLRTEVLRDIAIWVLAFLCMAASIILGASMFHRYAVPVAVNSERWLAGMLVTVMPVWLMGCQFLAMVLFVGFRDTQSHKLKADSDREWLARLSAVSAKPVLMWGLVAGTALLLNWWLADHWLYLGTRISSLTALASGGVAVAGGKSKKTRGATQLPGNKIFGFLPFNAIVSLATFVFLIAIFIVLARAEARIADAVSPLLAPIAHRLPFLDKWVMCHWIIGVALIILPLLASSHIRVNRFSLNGFYRNRLSRAFLGAARDRNPNPFTGFSSEDNVRMNSLLPQSGQAPVLFHIVNVALNVTATENLAWQERKAEPFIFTPLYSGSAMLKPPAVTPQEEQQGAYIKSTLYGGNEADLGMEGCGISLASAISISGAAASPNMGYHSSPATALLMTLFNVRLGAWLPNPALAAKLGSKITSSEPSRPLFALLRELAGSTTDKASDVYLSDGGHFENLGLYEMVRRRCRYIVVSDAGADPSCSFEDLGNAVRKAKIDLNVDIEFDDLRISSRDRPFNPPPQLAWALGRITYPEGGTGELLYLKPSLFNHNVPIDVTAYAGSSPTFPHEPTSDQSFSESQFESYRRLGKFITDGLCKKPVNDIPDFFRAIADEWVARSRTPSAQAK